MAGQQVIVSVLADTRRFNSAMAGTDRTLQRFQNSLRSVNRLGVAAFTALTYAAYRFTQTGIKNAADYESSTLGLINVFGDASDSVKKFATDAQNAAGLSVTAYQTAAARIGNALSVTKWGNDRVAKSTDNLIQMAADLSATYGGTVVDAVDAVNSALIGEYDGLQRLIPGISAAAIQNEALAMTGKKSAKALTAAEKAAATYRVMLKLTEKDQGAFARNSESFNVRLAKLTAAWTNASNKIFAAVVKEMGPALDDLTTWLNDFADSPEGVALAQELAGAFKQMAKDLPKVLSAFTKLLKKMNEMNISIGDVVIGWAGFTALLRVLSGNFFGAYLGSIAAAAKRNKAWTRELRGVERALLSGTDMSTAFKKSIEKLEKKQQSATGLTKKQAGELKDLKKALKDNEAGLKKVYTRYYDLNDQMFKAGKYIDDNTGKVKSLSTAWQKLTGGLTKVGAAFQAIPTWLKGGLKLFARLSLILTAIEVAFYLITGIIDGFKKTWDDLAKANPEVIKAFEEMGFVLEDLKFIMEGLNYFFELFYGLIKEIGKFIGTVLAGILFGILATIKAVVDGLKFITGWKDPNAGKIPLNTSIGPVPAATPSPTPNLGGNMSRVTNNNNIVVNSLVPTAETGRIIAKSLNKYSGVGGRRVQ